MDETEGKLYQRLQNQEAASAFKAHIRAEVYKYLLKQGSTVLFPKADLKAMQRMPKSTLGVDIIREFMNTHEIAHTNGVFKLEAEAAQSVTMKKTLEDRCGVKTAPGQSVLEAILDKLRSRALSADRRLPEVRKAPSAVLPGLRLPDKAEIEKKQAESMETKSRSKHALMQLRAEKEVRPPTNESEEDIEEVIEEEPLEIIRVQDSGPLTDSQGTSSMGADASADSLALESCDHVEKIPKSPI